MIRCGTKDALTRKRKPREPAQSIQDIIRMKHSALGPINAERANSPDFGFLKKGVKSPKRISSILRSLPLDFCCGAVGNLLNESTSLDGTGKSEPSIERPSLGNGENRSIDCKSWESSFQSV